MGGNAVEKKGWVAPDGRIFCWSEGFRCIVATVTADSGGYVFLAAKRESAAHDKTLQDLAIRMTQLIDEAAKKAPSPQLKLGFLRTGSGLMPVWKTDIPDGDDIAKHVALDSLRSLDDMGDDELARTLNI